MGWILLIFVFFSALFALAVKHGISIVGRQLGARVSQRHKWAEEVLQSGKVPQSWYLDFAAGKGKRFPRGAEDREFRIRARRYFLRRLDELVKYFNSAPVFDNDETRRMLIQELQEARRHWANDSWTDIIKA